MNIKIGDVIWTCIGSVESQNYGDDSPCRPHNAKVSEIIKDVNDNPSIYIVHAFNVETGVLDFDTNATCYVRPSEVFNNEEDCLRYYQSMCKLHLSSLLTDAAHYAQEAGIDRTLILQAIAKLG